jgi:hypothetical protein
LARRISNFSNMLPSPNCRSPTTHGALPRFVTVSLSLPFDLRKIGEVLGQHNVRYVVIGGMSGAFHGMVDYRTKHVDLWCRTVPRISVALLQRLAPLGAVPFGTTDRWPIIGAELAAASTQWDADAGPVDVLVTAAWTNESIVVYDVTGPVPQLPSRRAN